KGLSSYLHLPVVGVTYQSKLYEAGLRSGDHITKIDDEDIKWYKDLEPTIMENLSSSTSTVLTVKRFKNFRKADSFDEFTITLQAQNFKNHQLGLFIPETVVAEVVEDSPAAAAGLQRLDIIKSINGNSILSFDDIVANVSSFNQSSDALEIEVLRDDQSQIFKIEPQMNSLEGEYGAKENRFTIGVVPVLFSRPQTYVWKSETVAESFSRALEQTGHWSQVTVLSFVRILQNRISSKNISGIISIGQVAQRSWSIGLSPFLKMMAIISINLFILNLLPIPILDGGHLVIFTLEAIKGSPISLKKIEIAHQIGFIIILFLMAFALFNDFSRIFGS
ncbi:MAG: RIP metalloprotease RseP, partial [Bdellovibrionales bacterium]|nr:RIP metalloprotease RseP [Bdellovibrionales bacterium]NQZ19492.1 RIP metalloprotease RseP [Bdellovibrionales bacterium]